MNRARLRDVAHAGLPFDSPLAPDALAALLDGAGLPPAPRILDLGCGRGGMLSFALRHTGGSGLGIDLAPGTPPGVTTRAGDMLACEEEGFDLVMCVGALPGDRVAALRGFRRHAPRLLLAELVRTRPIHGPLAVLPDEARVARELVEAGWRPGAPTPVGAAAMVAYEAAWMGNVEAYVAAGPDDPDRAGFRAHLADRRRWMQADALDFVAFVARA